MNTNGWCVHSSSLYCHIYVNASSQRVIPDGTVERVTLTTNGQTQAIQIIGKFIHVFCPRNVYARCIPVSFRLGWRKCLLVVSLHYYTKYVHCYMLLDNGYIANSIQHRVQHTIRNRKKSLCVCVAKPCVCTLKCTCKFSLQELCMSNHVHGACANE